MSAIENSLAMVMLFGAAKIDADREQLGRLRYLVTLMRDHDIAYSTIVSQIRLAMGEDWRPRADFARQIECFKTQTVWRPDA